MRTISITCETANGNTITLVCDKIDAIMDYRMNNGAQSRIFINGLTFDMLETRQQILKIMYPFPDFTELKGQT